MNRIPVPKSRNDATASKGSGDAPMESAEIVAGASLGAPKVERRMWVRSPVPYTFRLTPIDENGQLRDEEATTIVGKSLSPGGIGFSHDCPLTCRRAIISLDHPTVGRFAVEAEIIWSRRTPLGLYESGGRLIRTVDGHFVQPNA